MDLERRDGLIYLVGESPGLITVSSALLETHDRRWMVVTDTHITFTLANGTWRYRIIDRDQWLLTVTARLLPGQVRRP